MSTKITALLLFTFLLSTSHSSQAQQRAKIPRIGVLLPSPTGVNTYLVSFRQGLEDLGYMEGKTLLIEYRIAEAKSGQYPGQYAELAADLVSLDLDVIVTSSGPAVQALKKATKTIPIVMAAVADPLGTGIVASLARPGNNVTGLSMRSPEISGKRLQLLKEVVPSVRRVAVVCNPTNPSHSVSFRDSQTAAKTLGLQVQSIELQDPGALGRGLTTITKSQTDAFTVFRDSFFLVNLNRFVEFAVKSRLPAIYDGTEFVRAGGLMSYAARHLDLWRRAATFVDKILKGSQPADLPIEQSMATEFIINLTAAKRIGLTIPAEVLQRADKVIK